MNSLFDPKKITEAMNYELDKELFKELFSIKDKPKLKYTVIEKKMIYDNQANPITFKRSDDYFANYKFFRKYLMTGYNTDFAMRELQKAETLISFSTSLRRDINNQFKLNMFNEKEEHNEGTGIVDLIKNALLKLRRQPNTIGEGDYNFSLYSEYMKASDQFSVPQSQNHIKVKFYNQNRCLTNSSSIETNFINCVRKFSVKELKNPQNPFFAQNSTTRINNTQIQSLFYGRDIDYFKSIDTFMSYYKEDFFMLKNRERDLFIGLYKILSHSNCLNFLSFLYTKSILFKYIYDIFTRKKKNVFDKLNIPGIEGEENNEAFLNDSMRYYFGEKSIEQKPTPPPKQNVRNFTRTITMQNIKETTPLDSYQDLFGCLFFDNIMYVKDKIMYSDIIAMLNKSQSQEISMRNDYDFIKGCLLINKNKEMKLFPYDILRINNSDLHEHLDNVDFIKPDMKLLSEDLTEKIESDEILYLVTDNNNEDKSYYALKMSNEVNEKLSLLIDDRYKHFNEEFDCGEKYRKSDMDSDNLSKMNYSQNRSGY